MTRRRFDARPLRTALQPHLGAATFLVGSEPSHNSRRVLQHFVMPERHVTPPTNAATIPRRLCRACLDATLRDLRDPKNNPPAQFLQSGSNLP